jgi:hypothetical protein
VTTFITGDKLSYTGGTIISYILFDGEGDIKSSATFYKREPRTRDKNIKDNLRRTNEGSVIVVHQPK